VPARDLTIWAVFVAAGLSVTVLLAAFLAALVISQRRRIAAERDHARRLLAAQEEERSRIARDIHDDALQRIAVIRQELDVAAEHGGDRMGHRITGIAGELEDLGFVLRATAHQLHPSVVEKAGLARALGALGEEFGRTAGLTVRTALPPADVRTAPGVGVAAYRIAQEALRNVVRHAGVDAAEVSLEVDGSALTLRIADRGKGLGEDASGGACGLGLISMRQRAEGADGRLTVAARTGGGTEVTARFPRGALT
jgi:two-component system sensor histidine kinase UhpB